MFHLWDWQRLLWHSAAWLWNAHVAGAQPRQLPVSTVHRWHRRHRQRLSEATCCAQERAALQHVRHVCWKELVWSIQTKTSALSVEDAPVLDISMAASRHAPQLDVRHTRDVIQDHVWTPPTGAAIYFWRDPSFKKTALKLFLNLSVWNDWFCSQV